MKEKYIVLAKKNIFFEWLVLTSTAISYIYNRKKKDDELFRVIRHYNGNTKSIHLVRELLWTRYIAGCVYQQYFQFGFADKTKNERREYIGSYEFHDFLMKNSTDESRAKFDDKFMSYNVFRNYYRREVISVNTMEDYARFAAFVGEHKSFVIKPIASYGGSGFRIMDSDTTDIKKTFFSIISDGGAVCEEQIFQCDFMACFHPQSLNTVRIVTYFDGIRATAMYSFIRMGQGESRVDNSTAGGLAAAVDLETGKIVTRAASYKAPNRTWYDCHPDTGARIIGSVIPRWQELLDMVQELAKIVPEQKCVGWDMALTDSGWVVVEANAKPIVSIIQVLTQKGIRKKYKDLLK